MAIEIRTYQGGDFEWIQEGEGEPVILLHGLFGTLSNWRPVLEGFQNQPYRIYIPLLPIYQGNVKSVETDLNALADFVIRFCQQVGIKRGHFVGNSLGGHIALLCALHQPELTHTLTLTGSSGLFEAGLGSTYPKRNNWDYVKARVEFTFYDPKTATDELVNEVFDIVNDRTKALRVIGMARAAQKMNLRNELPLIHVPTCLIWGLNDNITPPRVAHEFHRLLPNSELHFIDHCGHAPMMEQPERFNALLSDFLKRHPIPC